MTADADDLADSREYYLLPASSAQQRMYYLALASATPSGYNVPLALRLRGSVDVEALHEAVEAVYLRHEALRSHLVLVDGKIMQAVDPDARLTWSHTATDPQHVQAWVDTVAAEPFDLSNGPLFRASLADVVGAGAQEHVLVMSMHHAVVDGWSVGVLLEQLWQAYDQVMGGAPIDLPQSSFDYGDYAAWQEEWLHSAAARKQEQFWEEFLTAAETDLVLPTDRVPAGTDVEADQGAVHAFAVPEAVSRRLATWCEQSSTSLSNGLLAVYAILLHRISAQTTFTVGTPIANRTREEFERTVGLFVNTIVLPVHVDPTDSATSVLQKTTVVALDAFDHQELPYERVVRSVRGRTQRPEPLFRAFYVMQNTPRSSHRGPRGVAVEPVHRETTTAKFDLSLEINSVEGEMRAVFEYKTALFEAETVETLASQYLELLEAVVRDPTTEVRALTMRTPAPRSVDLRHRAQTDQGSTLPARVHRHSAASPDSIAVVGTSTSYTYGQLHQRSSAIAAALIGAGVRRGSTVGVCMTRDAHLVAALLGVMQAGAAYVPLDPVNPVARLRAIAADARTVVVLVDSPSATVVVQLDPLITVVEVGAIIDVVDDDASGEGMIDLAAPDDAAYVIFTSGSTGRPKGTVVAHYNVLALLDGAKDCFGYGPDDVWSMFHSYAFDFSVWEIWGALCSGGRVVVADYETTRTPERFVELVHDQGVTMLSQTPSSFRQVRDLICADPGRFASLRHVVFGGEALDPAALAPWFAAMENRGPSMVNMYGITETTVHVTFREMTAADSDRGEHSPIGSPLPHLDVVLADRDGAPVPVGVAGELLVRGTGVARGYLGRPALTAERFVPDPFGPPGARLYRSGDVGRRSAAGDIVYLGRDDDQVKIRGFRIELGEVRAALTTVRGVTDAVVLLDGDDDEPGLLALVASEDPANTGPALRAALRNAIPEYMVPRRVVVVDRLPLTVNGKLDQTEARRITTQAPVESVDAVPPRNERETALLDAWNEVLGGEVAGVHEHFHDVGGDSIRSIRVVAACRQRGLPVDVAALMRHPTVARLSAHLADVADDAQTQTAASVEPFGLVPDVDRDRMPAGVEDAYPMTALQGGMLFASQVNPGSGAYHNVTRYRVDGSFDVDAWRWAFAQCVRRHPILRTSFETTAFSCGMQLVHVDPPLRVGVDTLPALPPEAVELRLDEIFAAEVADPFDVGEPGLIRMRLIETGAGAGVLFLAEHHSILDGWSERSLLAELLDLYRHRLGADTPGPAPSPHSTVADYVSLEQHATADATTHAFWAEQIADAPLLELPVDSRSDAGSTTKRFWPVGLTASVSQAVLQASRQWHVPVRLVLLAAHLRVLNVIGGVDDIVTGVVYNGRPETADGDQVCGLFLQTLPFRAHATPGSFGEFVQTVAALDTAITAHRRYPLRQILADVRRGTLFDTFFNFTNFTGLVDRAADESLAAGLRVEADRSVAPSEFTLGAEFSLTHDRIDLSLRYDHELLGGDPIERIAGYYREALAQVVAGDTGAYRARSLLSDRERQALAEAGGGAIERTDRRLVHELVEGALRADTRVQVLVGDDTVLSADDLLAQSALLARRLTGSGVRPGQRVGLLMRRSVHYVVAMLGVLRAGAAFVPLDPASPDRRTRAQAEQAGLSAVVIDPNCPAPAWCDVVVVAGEESDELGDLPEPGSLPGSLPAYVIFTSGSTGRPKGVEVSHTSLMNRLEWMQSAYPIDQADNVLHKTPATFDVSVWELLWPLLVGARLVVARADGHADPDYLVGVLRREHITVAHFVPTMLESFLNTCPDLDDLDLRHLICSGEALSAALSNLAYRRLGLRIHNLYGPTEAAIDVTRYECAPVEEDPVPIGHAIDNIAVTVLDSWGLPAPWGVTGEIALSGVGLAHGYVGAPSLTAERFVAGETADGRGTRFYLTGDIGRLDVTGSLEYRGRRDDQVKVRGVRVELGEVEGALLESSAVREARVVVAEDSLVAYVVPSAPGDVRSHELRQWCADRVPASMVPSHVVGIEALPLTTSGKLDRRALPSVASRRMSEPVSPGARTPRERALAEVWAETLGRRDVAITEDVFAAGAHSLDAIRLVAAMRNRLGVQVSLTDLMRSRTIEKTIQMLSGEQATPQGRGQVLLPAAVGGHCLGYTTLLPLLAQHFDVRPVDSTGLRPGEMPPQSIEDSARRVLEAVDRSRPVVFVGWSMGGLVGWCATEMLAAEGVASRLVLLDTAHPENLEAPNGQSAAELLRTDLERSISTMRTPATAAEVPEVEFERMRLVLESNLAAARAFVPGVHRQPTMLVRAARSTPPEDLASWLRLNDDSALVHVADADHYTLMHDPFISSVAPKIVDFVTSGWQR